MTKPEITEEQEQLLLKCLAKAVSYFIKKTGIDEKRIEQKHSINQSKLNTEIFSYFIINKEEEK